MKTHIFLKLIIILIFPNLIFSQEVSYEKLDIEELKNNPELIEILSTNNSVNSAFDTGNDLSVDSLDLDEDSLTEDFPEEKSPFFGFDFIAQIPKSISSTSDLPVPYDYSIALGDSLQIVLTGGKKASFVLDVNLDGTVILPELGPVVVSGETIEEVRNKLRKLIEISYVGTEVSVSLQSLAARKINILGAVKNPGTYIVNPFSTLSSVLSYAGGFENFASLRGITLIRKGKKTYFDLYDLLVYGDRKADINIHQGDTILVGSTNKYVEISGEVNRPFIYEYKRDDTYQDLINFSMGLTRNANIQELYASSLSDGLISYTQIELNEIIGEKDLVDFNIYKYSVSNQLDLQILGNGVSQKIVKNKNNLKLADVISSLSFSKDIYPYYATFEQDGNLGILKENYLFSLSDPSTYSDIEVKMNGKITFFSREDVLEKDIQETISNNFRAESIVELIYDRGTLSLPIIGAVSLEMLANFLGLQETHDLTKSNILFNDGSLSTEQSNLFNSEKVSSVFLAPDITTKTLSIEVIGLVERPGKYKVPIGTTLNDIYKIVGGLLPNADPESIFLSRQRIRDIEKQQLITSRDLLLETAIGSVNNSFGSSASSVEYASLLPIIAMAEEAESTGRLTGDLSPDSNLSKMTLVEQGDIFEIKPFRNTVTVLGQVLNPITLVYDSNLDLNDYIKLSGRFTDFADEDNIYIIRKNGTSIPYDSKLFAMDIDILPGDTIVVPRDLTKVSTLPLIMSATQVISNIAFAAASLNSLR